MKVLVTGASGFLGGAICRALLARGDQVIGFSRTTSTALERLGATWCRGDVRDAGLVAGACRGVDAVVHTAAVAGVWGRWEHYHAINTLGTENVIAGCLYAGVPILVHCSSPSVTFDGKAQSGINESTPYAAKHLCHYSHTKALAESAVLMAHQPPRLRTVALRPHLIWGVGDPHLLPRLVARARAGRLFIVGDGTNLIDTVHVENAAEAHLQALDCLTMADSPVGGKAFFITQDEPVNCWQWISTLLEVVGCRPPQRRIRFQSAWRLGTALEGLYTVLRKQSEPPMTRFLAAQLALDHYFDISAAKRLLRYQPRISTMMGLEELRESLASTPP